MAVGRQEKNLVKDTFFPLMVPRMSVQITTVIDLFLDLSLYD